MTITIPNYQIRTNEPTLVKIDANLYIESMNTKHHKVQVRNTMHGLVLVEYGSKEVEFEGSFLELGKDSAIFFAQGNYFFNQNSKDYKAITIFFDDEFIVNFVNKYQIKLNTQKKNIIIIDYKKQENISKLISTINPVNKEKISKYKELLKLKIELLFLEFYQACPKQIELFFQHIILTSKDRMRYILEENIDLLEKVSDMHRLMRMSASRFQKQFYKNFHESPKVWLDKERMKKAKFLLVSTSKSISQIATDCKYSSSSWFIVQFKKYYKITPKEYRVKNRYK